jgi:chromosome segregation ATPase
MAAAGLTDAQFATIMGAVTSILAVGGAWLTTKTQARRQAIADARNANIAAADNLIKGLEWRVENIERALNKCEERCERQVAQLDSQLEQIRELRRQNMRQGDEIAELKRQDAIKSVRLAAVEKKTTGDGPEHSD